MLLPVGLLVLVLVLAFLIATRIGKVSSSRARTLVASGAKLVDVRTPAEFGRGHLDGAVNVPLAELVRLATTLGSKDDEVVVYCASGMRSGFAKQQLVRRGFKHVHDLGSMSRW